MDVPTRPCLSASADPTRITEAPSRKNGNAFWTVKNTPLNKDVAEFVEKLLGHTFDGRKFGDACVGDQNINLSKSRAGLVEEALKISEFSDVPLECQGLSSQASCGMIQCLLVSSEDYDLCAVGLELTRRRKSYS